MDRNDLCGSSFKHNDSPYQDVFSDAIELLWIYFFLHFFVVGRAFSCENNLVIHDHLLFPETVS